MKVGDLVRLKCNHSQVTLVRAVTPSYVYLYGFLGHQAFDPRDLEVISESR